MLDPALPQMARLLDPDEAASLFERALGRPAALTDTRCIYLRYKPATNLRAQYEVRVEGVLHQAVAMIAARADLARRAVKPANATAAAAVNGRSPASQALVYDGELDALVQWLPLDLALPGLTEPPQRLRRRMREAGVPADDSAAEPPRLAYKAHRRAVLRVDGHVVKAYGTDARYRAAEARLRAGAGALGVTTAPFAAAIPDLRVTVQPVIDGEKADAQSQARAAGELLRALHESRVRGLESFPAARQQEVVAGFGEMVKAIAPGLRARVERVLGRLASTAPTTTELVCSHGDFHQGQLLRQGGDLVLIDLDEMTAAPRALDLATYAAHQVWGGPGDLALAREVLERLVEGYGTRPPALEWYLSALLLRRASHPFRRMRDGWPDRVEAVLAAAEEVR